MIETLISSSVLILAVCAIRFVLRGKINPRVQYALWGMPALRLVVGVFYPVTKWLTGFRSRFSVMNAAEQFHERVITGTPVEPLADNLISGHVYTFENAEHIALKAAGIDWQLWIMVIWGIGALALVTWMGVVNKKFLTMLKAKRSAYTGNVPAFVTKSVYLVPELASPCYFSYLGDEGIYLPTAVAESETGLRHSLAHEMGHVMQGDRRWGDLRCSLLCMFWINPLVWVAAILSKRDCELACDEVAVGLLGDSERFSYGRTLVGLISRKSETRSLFCSATTMAEGKKAVKERIEVLAKNPKRTVPMMLCIGCIVAVLAACTFTSAADDNGAGREPDEIVADVVGRETADHAAEKEPQETVEDASEKSVQVESGQEETKQGNREVYRTYSFNQVLKGIDGTTVTLVAIEEYPDELHLILKGSSEDALRQFHEKNTVYLSWNGVDNEFEWSSVGIAPEMSSEERLVYVFGEDTYPIAQVEEVVCVPKSGKPEFVINELKPE